MEREPRVSSLSLNIPTAMMASRRKCVGRVLRHCHYEVAGLCCVPPWLASPQTPRERGVKTSLAYGAFQIPGKPEMRGGCGHVTPNCGSVTYQCVKLSVYPHDDHSNTRASTALRARYFYMHTHTHTHVPGHADINMQHGRDIHPCFHRHGSEPAGPLVLWF